MNVSWLEGPEDMLWASEVHKVQDLGPDSCAIIEGNEDCPEVVTVYASNHLEANRILYRMHPESGQLEAVWAVA